MIKVSDEAWRQAEETWNEHINCGNGPEKALRAALAAAVPHLQVQASGDDGLREALRELAKERDCVNGAVPSDYFITPYEILELLRTHPAATAVPQPVDREALATAAHMLYCLKRDEAAHPLDEDDYDKADEVIGILGFTPLAGLVLAGEPEEGGEKS